MDVRVLEARGHGPPAELDHPRRRADQRRGPPHPARPRRSARRGRRGRSPRSGRCPSWRSGHRSGRGRRGGRRASGLRGVRVGPRSLAPSARAGAVPSRVPRRPVDAGSRRGSIAVVASVHLLHAGYADDRVGSSVTLIRDGDALIVADPGMVASRSRILDPLAALDVAPEAVTHVFISHHHPDHTVNIALFPNAEVVDFWARYRDDLWLDHDGDGYHLSPNAELWLTPGHTERGRVAHRHGRGRDLRPDPPLVARRRDPRDRPARRRPVGHRGRPRAGAGRGRHRHPRPRGRVPQPALTVHRAGLRISRPRSPRRPPGRRLRPAARPLPRGARRTRSPRRSRAGPPTRASRGGRRPSTPRSPR